MRIIFVCTGNTCRSPMAESIALALLPHHQIESRGLMAHDGDDVSSHTLAVLTAHQYPTPTNAKRFQEEDASADLILTMTREHKHVIEQIYKCNGNVFTLKEFLNQDTDIPDPFGGTYDMYLTLFHQLEKDIFKLKEQID
ncbi:low molecular weight protein arginine phosphatase [Staphylococcus ratti]|uniref:Low molecular weight protein-tyrosine-phosphatase PtpB n=1 Tax=Staphylococcus ratti TaxID=2892440 RepID=A0ABY3PEI3_9STAP|nr:low molecular weight protein arginine phosphatase [Staphylococcus ratti]UEX90681.1 low molecular weight protein arginine phosphatase [Staphylococcus ratti]